MKIIIFWFKFHWKLFPRIGPINNNTKFVQIMAKSSTGNRPLSFYQFLIYIKDLYSIFKHTMPILFTDDTILFSSGKDNRTLENKINNELLNIYLWLKVNNLSLNIKKTHYMVFCRRKKLNVDMKLLINGEAIDEVQPIKFVGIIIDNKLSWKYHIDHISGKIAREIGMTIKAREYLNKQGLLSLYYSFIYPYLTYCNHIWGSTYISRLRRLITLQNKALKIIAHARFRASCDPIYQKLNIMKLENINTYLIGHFMHCVFIQKPPEPLRSLFKNSEYHSYNTRSVKHYHIPPVKLDLSKTGIKCRGAIIWNLIVQTGINLNVSEAVSKKCVIRLINNNEW